MFKKTKCKIRENVLLNPDLMGKCNLKEVGHQSLSLKLQQVFFKNEKEF